MALDTPLWSKRDLLDGIWFGPLRNITRILIYYTSLLGDFIEFRFKSVAKICSFVACGIRSPATAKL